MGGLNLYRLAGARPHATKIPERLARTYAAARQVSILNSISNLKGVKTEMRNTTKGVPKRKKLVGASSTKNDERSPQLGYEGTQLFLWCQDHFDDCESVEPLLIELCQLADRLAEIRRELAKGLDARLLSAEVKFANQYARAWKLLGLADPPKAGRPRPPGWCPSSHTG
jgi:hypothetical protein